MNAPAAVVGIDLGTTHTVVAWAAPGADRAEIFPIPQLVGAGELAASRLLPSTLYCPTASETFADPWDEAPWRTGIHAKTRAQQVPGRGVSSAKSWLSHTSVDRTAAILPWGHAQDAEAGPGASADALETQRPRISPVDASAFLLTHIRKTWNEAFPERLLEEQLVVLTVPASFDEVARELTVQAAHQAGLDVRLLEEPQAAFYDLLANVGAETVAQQLQLGDPSAEQSEQSEAGETVLVCDVGGGTTDLSLIQLTRQDGTIEVNRVAVGRHLLLGGDNMDLALAHACEQRLIGDGKRLTPPQFAQLVLACARAKEQLLGAESPETVPIAIAKGGAQLVGGTLRTELAREDVRTLLLDGFFPVVAPTDRPKAARAGLMAFGLPYERDPSITRHIADFCARHGGLRPKAVLLNGGPFKARAIVNRLLETLSGWRVASGSGDADLPTRHLQGTDPDLSVARGAVAFGLALLGKGARIGGGSSHAYYVALAGGGGNRGMCVLPRGSREGERHSAGEGALALVVGRPVRFDLFANEDGEEALGDVTELRADTLETLPPLITTFDARTDQRQGEEVPVRLEAEFSAVGTLELACVETSAPMPRRFRLAFDLRGRSADENAEASRASKAPRRAAQLPPGFGDAKTAIERVFGSVSEDLKGREVRQLIRELERCLGERASWDTELNRALFDLVGPKRQARKRSSDHERIYWMLVGYTLRPGFGHPLDEQRMKLLAPLFSEALTFKDEARNWPQLFIAWRRLAGGLRRQTQEGIRDRVDPFLTPRGVQLKKPRRFRPQAPAEMLETAAFLERVDVGRKVELGKWVLERTWTERDARLWSALGRLGSRVPAYASAHEVLPARHAETWLDHLLRERWEEIPTAAWTATLLARVTGDRSRDLDEAVRREVAARLESINARPEWIQRVREFVALDETARADLFGEALPVGLKWVQKDNDD